MKRLFFGTILVLLSACNTVSSTAMTEVADNAASGERCLNLWDRLTEQEKKAFVYRFTRTCHNIRGDVLEIPVPEKFLVQCTDPNPPCSEHQWAAKFLTGNN